MSFDQTLYLDPDYEGSQTSSWWGRPFRESSYVARIYANSLRDNFIKSGITDPEKLAELEAIKAKFNEETSRKHPRLDVLLKIEAHLVHILPPDVTKNRFWSILDRFERVVPALTRAQYWGNVPPKGSAEWNGDEFLVGQARALLDVIHSNYMINLGREESTRRLKFILLGLFGLATLAIAIWAGIGTPSFGYAALAYAGMLGAIMSVIQRLQTAVSHDAMTTDGVFELLGLRLGWLSIVLSVLSGGVFALVLYYIVMAGMFSAAVPAATMTGTSLSAQSMKNRLSAEINGTKGVIARKRGEISDIDAGKPGIGTPAEAAARRAKLSSEIDTLLTQNDARTVNLEYVTTEAEAMTPSVNRAASHGVVLAKNIGLLDGPSFFKMLVLSFLAGFAERLVPDILERLRKNVTG